MALHASPTHRTSKRGACGVIVFALAMPAQFVNGAQRPHASQLEQGSIEQRLEALDDLLGLPPAERDPDLGNVMMREIARVLAQYRSHVRLSRDDAELRQEYVVDLISGLGESGELRAMPLIAEFAGFSRLSIDALLRYGDKAVPVMLEVAYRANDELNARGGSPPYSRNCFDRGRVHRTPSCPPPAERRLRSLPHRS